MALRLAVRRLASTPAFTVGAIAVLALGTGATFAVYTVLNALALKTLPVPDPARLVAIEIHNARGKPAALPRTLFDILSERQHSLQQVTGILGGSVVSAEAGGSAHQAVVDGVTADYFALLAVPVAAGRPLEPADYRSQAADAEPVAVVSEGYASRLFGAPASALGRAITLGETTVIVVGVTSDSFPGIQVGVKTDIVVPAPLVERIIGLTSNSVPLRYVFGRLAADRSIDDVRAEWSAIWRAETVSSAAGLPAADVGERRLIVMPGARGVSWWRSRYVSPLRFTLFASLWLIVIACANLAGLQLARMLRREQETAISRALGASDWQVIAPTVLESFLVSAAGLAIGAPLAGWGAILATGLLSTGSVPLTLDLTPGWSAWAMFAALAVAVTMGTGIVPAWLSARRTRGPRTSSRIVVGQGRVGSALVAGQVALAVVLLSGAALAVDALLRAAWRGHGFETDRVLAAQLMNRPGGYTTLDDAVYYRTLLEQVASLPGVSAAAIAKPVPGASTAAPIQQPIAISGRATGIDAGVVMASPGYFDVLGLRVRAGRSFDWRDTIGAAPVAVVSRALSGDLMPEGFRPGLRIDIGRQLHHRGLEVVGIAEDASVLNARDKAPRVVYVSTLQQPPPFARWPGLIVRTTSDARAVAPMLVQSVDELGHEFVARAETLSAHITRSLARERLLAGMAIVYGTLAIAMVVIGLWTLLAHDVTRRLREFGVRLSLGASPAVIYRGVTVRAVRLAVMGLVPGAALTWVSARVLIANVGLDDAAFPRVLAGVASLLLILGCCAAIGPARRAARAEPMVSLRSE